jgi:hypothetical protein
VGEGDARLRGCYWKQLSDAFPEALVILSVRDTESWWASMLTLENHYVEERRNPELITDERRAYLDFFDAIYPDALEGMSEEREKAFFDAHNRRVLEFAARDASFKKRLLVWRAEDGWGPLCQALDLPVPRIPFPHKNKRAEFHGY